MKASNKLLKIFVKDFNIPINVFDRGIFENQINILGYKEELNDFLRILENFNSEEDYFVYRKNLQDDVINYISSSNVYTENITIGNYEFNFLDLRINKDIRFSFPFPFKTEKNLYTEKNLNKKFISIDMKNANFQVMQVLQVVNEFNDYRSLMKKFDTFDYFWKSKNIRQVIFGNLNPKKSTSIQKMIINALLVKVLENSNIDFDTVIINNDELILSYDDSLDLDFMKKSNIKFRMEIFELKGFYNINNKLFYYKKYDDKKVIYTVPKNLYIQAYKKVNNIDITDEDLMFYYEGSLVKYLVPQFQQGEI